MQPHTCLYPAADDQRFRQNVTGDSAGGSALLLFFTPVGHDQSTCADCRDLGSIGRESGRQVWRVDTVKLRRAVRLSPRVLPALCDTVRAGVDADQLLSETRVILYERRYVIPASRTLGDLAQLARSTVEREIGAAVERMISPAARERWVEQYAGRMRNQRRSRFAQRKEPRRSIELVSFLRHSLAAHTDALIRMADRRASRPPLRLNCRVPHAMAMRVFALGTRMGFCYEPMICCAPTPIPTTDVKNFAI